jgi:hypothetical protein
VFSLVCQVPEVPARLADPTYSELVPSDKRHIESNNLAFLIEILKLKQLVALIAVNNKQLVTAYYTSLYMLDKVLQPGKTKLISSLAVLANTNPLI